MSIGKATKCEGTMGIDFGVFQNKDSKCKSMVECKSIHRIITGLLYYQTLTNKDNYNHYGKQIFSDFLCSLYPHYLNDIIHLNIFHFNDNDLEEINNIILNQAQYSPCNINKCMFIDRHLNILDGLNGDINSHKNFIEPLSSFHIQIWDQIHYYLIHIFEIG